MTLSRAGSAAPICGKTVPGGECPSAPSGPTEHFGGYGLATEGAGSMFFLGQRPSWPDLEAETRYIQHGPWCSRGQ
jgi:hypothetical protein